MIVFRIAAPKWAGDLSGNGAKLYGGRWNSPGLPMLYTSENSSLAMLEILVNSPIARLQMAFRLIEIAVPDDLTLLFKQELPKSWNIYPHDAATAQMGDQWLQEQKSLCLKVPSSANPFEYNVLINPLHPLAIKLQVQQTQPLAFDHRLMNLET